jgi:hypothetical protein
MGTARNRAGRSERFERAGRSMFGFQAGSPRAMGDSRNRERMEAAISRVATWSLGGRHFKGQPVLVRAVSRSACRRRTEAESSDPTACRT